MKNLSICFTCGRYWNTTILLFVFGLVMLTLDWFPSAYIDEYWIASIMVNSFGKGIIVNDALRNFSSNYIDTQPFFTLLIGGTLKAFGHSLIAIRVLSAISIFLSAILIQKILVRLQIARENSIQVPLMLISTPIIWRTAHICRPEPLVLLFVCLAVYSSLSISKNFVIEFLKGLLIALPIFFYVTGVIVVPLIFFIFLYFYSEQESKGRYLIVNMIRGAGAVTGLILYFYIVGSPSEILTFYSESNISKVNLPEKGIIKRVASALRFYLTYQVENWFYYVPAWLIVAFHFLKTGFRGKSILLLLGLYVISAIGVILLSNKSSNYLIYSEFFFVASLMAIILNLERPFSELSKIYLFVVNLAFVIFYGFYFSGFNYKQIEAKIQAIITDNNVTVLARFSYKGFFFENNKFLGFEDYESLLKVGEEIDPSLYLKSNHVEWIIVDDAVLTREGMIPLAKTAENDFELVTSFQDKFIGHRIYDDVPYEWNIKSIVSKISIRPPSTIAIYKRRESVIQQSVSD